MPLEHKQTNNLKNNLWGVLLLTAMLSGLGAFALNLSFPDWRLVHYPVHAAIESVGAFAAFIVALLILGLRNHGHLGRSYTWVASALIGMGFLDGFHALHHAGTSFVWLHSVATLIGGVLFAGVWISDRIATHGWVNKIPKFALLVSAVLGLQSIAFPQWIPEMVVDGQFSIWARTTNIIGGLGFLAASVYFALAERQTEDGLNRVVFSSHCFLFGLSGVIFEFSVIWDAAWWFWHLLRICAYLIAVWFYFSMARSIERELYVLKKNLEDQVEQRTASLKEEVFLRQQAQASLRKIGMAIEQSPILVFITNAEGIIEYVNPKFEQITGYSKNEAIGRTPRILKSPDTPKEVYEDLWKTILTGKVWHGELKDAIKNGGFFWASIVISPIRNEAGTITHFVAMHEDITTRKQAEEAMQEARRAAEIANKAKTDMLANMSHELRTPLNAIIGFSEAFKNSLFGPLGDKKYADYGDYIHTSGTHLLELINDILDVSAVEAGKLDLYDEEVDLVQTCDAALSILYPKALEGQVRIKGLGDLGLPPIRGDQRRMKQIMLNLLSNAIKFTPEQGDVSCDAYVNDQGQMVVIIADTGIGMTSDDIATALSKFGQVDSSLSRKHDGTGLGLPLTKALVELHAGVMEVSSEPKIGTKITLTFPASRVIQTSENRLP